MPCGSKPVKCCCSCSGLCTPSDVPQDGPAKALAAILQDDPDFALRAAVAQSLARLAGKHGRVAIPALVRAVEDKELRFSVLSALGMSGPAGLPELQRLATHPEE